MLAVVLIESFLCGLAPLVILGFLALKLTNHLKNFTLLAIDEEVIATSVYGFQSDLGSTASEDALAHYTNTVAEYVSFLHRMSGKNDGSLSFLGAEDVPELSPVLGVESSRGFIEEDNFGV